MRQLLGPKQGNNEEQISHSAHNRHSINWAKQIISLNMTFGRVTSRFALLIEMKWSLPMCMEHLSFWWFILAYPILQPHFCTLMNKVFKEFLDKFIITYLDDIIVYSQTFEKHVNYLWTIFKVLNENTLFVKRKKCHFAPTKIWFLGHWNGKDSIRMDKSRYKLWWTGKHQRRYQSWDPSLVSSTIIST